ncbi:MAG: HAMP domain-containing histidine kinase [Ruminococcaceae bacterium]|nr:HAMP domain-containing histidine kinase [Oscillospiraceae bacterium]
MRSDVFRAIFKALGQFLVFFLIVSFVVTCAALLFITVLSNTTGMELTKENIAVAAKLTFINVVFISVIFTAVDAIRKKLTTERSVKHIAEAANKMIEGDFDARVKPMSRLVMDESYNEIIDCFNRMAEELSGVETLRADFISNVSHEMKTPLSVIQNYGRLLQSPGLSEEKRVEYAGYITDASKKLSDMMTNILKLNRLENQQIYPKAEDYDLGEQLCECLLQYEHVWEASEIEIETAIQDDVVICADAELLSLVWNNLLSNAFKFTKKGGLVSLALVADEEYVKVSVSDTGCGMSADVGAHIFEKFYQGDSSRATQGNGLGLALVKRVVDIVGGEISVQSTLGEGSTFTVKIRRR